MVESGQAAFSGRGPSVSAWGYVWSGHCRTAVASYTIDMFSRKTLASVGLVLAMLAAFGLFGLPIFRGMLIMFGWIGR